MPSKPKKRKPRRTLDNLNKLHLDLKLPEGFLETGTTVQGIPKARIAGAVAAGFGTYLMVRVFQKTAGDIAKNIASAAFAIPFFLTKAVTGFDPGAVTKEKFLGDEALLSADIEPFALSMALVVAGMIVAGQNPGEVLKGIGEIIPG